MTMLESGEDVTLPSTKDFDFPLQPRLDFLLPVVLD